MSWLSLPASGSATETQDEIFCIIVCTKFQAGYYIQICTHHQELMKSVGSHGSLLLLLTMVVVVWHFMSDSDKFITALIVMLHFVEFSPQSHRYVFLLGLWHQKLWRSLSWICYSSSSCKWHWVFRFLKIICDPRRIHASRFDHDILLSFSSASLECVDA
jgi:hypothetical protein